MEIIQTDISKPEGNDFSAAFVMRFRLASDPDVDASYTTVTTTRTTGSITYPYFDFTSLAAGVYVIHTYYATDGPGSGTKIQIEVTEPVPL